MAGRDRICENGAASLAPRLPPNTPVAGATCTTPDNLNELHADIIHVPLSRNNTKHCPSRSFSLSQK
jgi:hypothetical protein